MAVLLSGFVTHDVFGNRQRHGITFTQQLGEDDMQDFSLIIPTLNEAENIEPLLERILAMAEQSALQPEIIFVDDGSVDGTREKIAAYSGPLTVRLIRREHERGLTGAVVAGARIAGNDLVVVMDADLSHPPEEIPSLLAPIAAGSQDMVIGSRYVDGGDTPGWPLARRISSHMASLPARALSGVRDPLAGFFAVRREHLISINHDLSGFKVGLEVMASQNDTLRIKEIPIIFRDRNLGRSKMNLTVLATYLRQLSRLAFDQVHQPTLLLLTTLSLFVGLFDVFIFNLLINHGFELDVSNVSSFIATASLYLGLASLFGPKISQPFQPVFLLRYACICLMLLFLRGGMLSLPMLQANLHFSSFQTLFGIGSGLSLAAAFLLGRKSAKRKDINWPVFGSLLIGYTIVLRLVYMGNIELIQEEAYYWNYSRHLAAGYLDHPPMVALLIRFGTTIFGDTEFGVRSGAFLCWFITAFFSYRLAGTIFDRKTGFMVLILVASLPIFFGVGLVITPDAPLIACWSGALFFLYRALIDQKAGSWYGAGVCLGLGMASKYTIALLGPAILLFLLFDKLSRQWLIRREPYLAAFLAILLLSPVIWWNYQHDWASFLFQSKDRLAGAARFDTPELLASILMLLTPTGFLAAMTVMNPGSFLQQKMGVVAADRRLHRSHAFALTMVLIPLSVFLFFSFSRQVKLNWTGPIWLTLLPFMVHTMIAKTHSPRRLFSQSWQGTLVVFVLAYGAILHYCAIGLPGLTYGNSRDFLFGWDDLAGQLEEKIAAIDLTGGRHTMVAGLDRYRLASGIAFYRSKGKDPATQLDIVDETTSGQLFGWSAVMYEFWHPPTIASTRDVLVISQRRDKLAADRLASHGRRLGTIGEFTISKNGKKAGRFYYRLLTYYSPDKSLGTADSNVSSGRIKDHTAQLQQPTTMAEKDMML